MIIFESEVPPVIFNVDEPDYPHVDNNDTVPYMFYKANDNPSNQTIIKIGKVNLLPEQLETILKEVKAFDNAAESFKPENFLD